MRRGSDGSMTVAGVRARRRRVVLPVTRPSTTGIDDRPHDMTWPRNDSAAGIDHGAGRWARANPGVDTRAHHRTRRKRRPGHLWRHTRAWGRRCLGECRGYQRRDGHRPRRMSVRVGSIAGQPEDDLAAFAKDTCRRLVPSHPRSINAIPANSFPQAGGNPHRRSEEDQPRPDDARRARGHACGSPSSSR